MVAIGYAPTDNGKQVLRYGKIVSVTADDKNVFKLKLKVDLYNEDDGQLSSPPEKELVDVGTSFVIDNNVGLFGGVIQHAQRIRERYELFESHWFSDRQLTSGEMRLLQEHLLS